MTTTNPIEARRRRRQARIGSPRAALGIVIAVLMIFCGGTMMVRAQYSFAGGAPESGWGIVGMVGGLLLCIFGFGVYVGAARRYTGRLAAAPVIGPGTVLLAGFATGAWWGTLSHSLDGWLRLIPVGLTLLALISFGLGVKARARRRATRGVLNELVVRGVITPASITKIPEIDSSSVGFVGTITVQFTDSSGVDRWVQKTGQWERIDLPRTGDPATVLYDPVDPGNQERIWVGPPGSSTVTDFQSWHR